MTKTQYRFFDLEPPIVDVREEVWEGLSASPKRLSPKYFYDERGSELFEEITRQPEYYLTRTEIALIEEHLDEIVGLIGEHACLIEYGSGSSRKIRLLLEELRPDSYVPVDISKDHLETAARRLFDDYPWLNVYPTSADYSEAFLLPDVVGEADRLAFFPGSSIGNFEPLDAVEFLRNVSTVIGTGAKLLIGVDRRKDRETLERAYNDSAGVTARFNLNVLRHLNERLAANFDLAKFEHVAVYDENAGCVKMFLESTTDQVATVAGMRFGFRKGERIHTESSYKYAPQEFTALARRAGFEVQRFWTDERERFGLYLLRAEQRSARPTRERR